MYKDEEINKLLGKLYKLYMKLDVVLAEEEHRDWKAQRDIENEIQFIRDQLLEKRGY